MSIPKLAIIQARMGSKRLSGKVLLPIGNETLIERVHRLTCEAFGSENTVVAYPDTPENIPLRDELNRIVAQSFPWGGSENDVLDRFYHCAHYYRWHPDTTIIRVTPDDWAKDPAQMRRVANGERLPVEFGGEAFTLNQLVKAKQLLDQYEYAAHDLIGPHGKFARQKKNEPMREHITHAIFQTEPPRPPPGVWSIDTQEDYDEVCRMMANPIDWVCRQAVAQSKQEAKSPFDGGPWRPC